MNYVYVMMNGNDWEDIIVYLTEQDAIESSIKYPKRKVEIFKKNLDCNGYIPTYNYYKDGNLCLTNHDINDNKDIK